MPRKKKQPGAPDEPQAQEAREVTPKAEAPTPAKEAQKEREAAQQEPAQEVREDTGTIAGEILLEEIDPRLDPGSPDFDPQAFQDAIAGAGGVGNLIANTRLQLNQLGEKIAHTVNMAAEDRERSLQVIAAAMNNLTIFAASDSAKSMQEEWETFSKAWDAFMLENWDLLSAIADAPEEIRDLVPYIGQAMAEYGLLDENATPKKKAWQGATLLDILRDCITADGTPNHESIYWPIVERAKILLAEDEAAGVFDGVKVDPRSEAQPPKVTYKKSTSLKTTTDKLMNVFFSAMAPAAAGKPTQSGQREMLQLRYEGRKSKKEITLFYDYVFDDETLAAYHIPPGFDDYDYFVATALDNLMLCGNVEVSYTKILEAMGETGSPGQKQIEKLARSLIKGSTTTFRMDDMEVQKAWGVSNKYHEVISPVFPVKIAAERFIVNGRVADVKIKIMDYTPFRALAAKLGHETQWHNEVLRLYTGRKTDRYWSTMHYLIREIGWMRNPKSTRGNKILYASLYEYNGDKTTRAMQLTRDMLYRLLDEVFIPAGYVKKRKEDTGTSPGVIITLGTPPKLLE